MDLLQELHGQTAIKRAAFEDAAAMAKALTHLIARASYAATMIPLHLDEAEGRLLEAFHGAEELADQLTALAVAVIEARRANAAQS